MSLKVFYEILNQRDTPAMFADVFANRPAFGFNGRLFVSIDTKQIYRDYGTFWDLIADAGAGSGTLQSVCTNGNTTTTDVTIVSPGRLFIGALSNGGVLFPAGGSGQLSQDNTNFFWDNTNKRLGINTNTPGVAFDVHSTSQVIQQLNNTSTTDSLLSFLNQSVGKWRIGNYYNTNLNDFVIYDTVNAVYRAFFTNTGYTIFPTNLIIGSSNRSSAYGMDVYVSANLQSTLRVVGATTLLSQIDGTFAVFTGDLTIATNKLFVNSSTGNIGMGTITPEAVANNTTLEIDGTNHSFVRTGTSAYGGYFATIPTADVLVLSNVRNPVNGTFSNINKACSQISLFGASGDGYIVAATSPTNNGAPVERLRITSDGYLRLVSKGIQFNNDTADANSLDDYEEGTWTPLLTGGTSGQATSGGNTYGNYTKIGRLVTLNFVISLSSVNTLSGGVYLSQIPFNLEVGSGLANRYPQGSCTFSGLGSLWCCILIGSDGNTTKLLFSGVKTAASTNTSGLTNADITGSTVLSGSIQYIAS